MTSKNSGGGRPKKFRGEELPWHGYPAVRVMLEMGLPPRDVFLSQCKEAYDRRDASFFRRIAKLIDQARKRRGRFYDQEARMVLTAYGKFSWEERANGRPPTADQLRFAIATLARNYRPAMRFGSGNDISDKTIARTCDRLGLELTRRRTRARRPIKRS
jgi:hypothetical protein